MQEQRDSLMKAMAWRGQVRAYACCTTGLVEEMRQRHGTWPTATVALGRVASVAAMMGAMLKDEQQQIAIEIRGGGPIGSILVDAGPTGDLRGFVGNPHAGHPTKTEGVSTAEVIGRKGFLHVIRDMGMKEIYRGTIPLVTGEIGEDFAYYFVQSEQTPSAVGVGVSLGPDASVKGAGGFLLQMMPGAEESVIASLEKQISRLPSISQMIEAGATPVSLLSELLQTNFEILEERSLRFFCPCDRSRVERALISMGQEELRSLSENGESSEIHCDFCSKKYLFTPADLRQLWLQLA